MVFQTKYSFSKEELNELYINQKLSLSQIAKKFDCSGATILRALEKFNIQRRGAYFKKVDIPKEVLYDFYWNKNKTSKEIGKIFGVNGRTIIKKLKKFEIPRRTISEAGTKKRKVAFSGDLSERAYLLGLRTGDFHAKRKNISIRVQTTTTHPAQIELTKRTFEKYGEICTYLMKDYGNGKEWFVYVDLNSSFEFLLKKPKEIPRWILENEIYFYNYLAAYMDSEGSWCVKKSHKNAVRFTFSINTCDKLVLQQINNKLNILGFTCWIYLNKEKGFENHYGVLNNNLYHLVVNRKQNIINLAEILLKYSKHQEKIDKMSFILQNKNLNNWNGIFPNWRKILENIEKNVLK